MAKNRKRIKQRLQARKGRQRLKQKVRQKSGRLVNLQLKAGPVEIAWECIAHKNWEAAREVLEQEDRRCPGQSQVRHLLLDVYHELRQYSEYCEVCLELLEREPDNPPLNLMYAGGLLATIRPAMALQAFQKYVSRWPDDPLAEGVREQIADLTATLEQLTADWPFPPEDRLELAALNEELLSTLQTAPQRAIEKAKAILRCWPNFLPARNNLSEAHLQNGEAGLAIEDSRRVLEIDPNNIHARCNLARYLFLAGRFDEARPQCERLPELQPKELDGHCKLAEVFSLQGEDAAVLDVFRQAETAIEFGAEDPVHVALLHHLAAVAAARQGNERQARRYWRAAIKANPDFEIAAENLADLNLPLGQRNGPWANSISYWLPKPLMERFIQQVDRISRIGKGELAVARRKQLQKGFPAVVALIPHLLDRGDEFSRQFAIHVAMMLGIPETHAALLDFCLSQRGTDEMRMETLSYLREAGAAPGGPLRMRLKGQWHDIEAFATEITTEPTSQYKHSQRVSDLSYEAMQALHNDDGATAERLLREALSLEPDQPDLLNNLAMAIQIQGREAEAIGMVRKVHQRWPDYFFGCIAMASLLADQGNFEEAKRLLGSLSQRGRIHQSEFCAMCMAYIRLELRQGHKDEAQVWLDRWKKVDPDHPQLPRFKKMIASDGLLPRLSGLLLRRRFLK